MAETVLDLKTVVDRRIVRIDGTPYELKHPQELAVADYLRLGGKTDRVYQIERDAVEGKATEDQLVELMTVLDEIVGEVLLAPADIIKRLQIAQELAILEVFIALNPEQTTAQPEKSASEGPSIGPR